MGGGGRWGGEGFVVSLVLMGHCREWFGVWDGVLVFCDLGVGT